jgi:hypothetical protein
VPLGLTVDGSPLLNTVYVSLLTICAFAARSFDNALTSLRGTYLPGSVALTQARLEREITNLMRVASANGEQSAVQIIQAELFPPLLEGQRSLWAETAWPLIHAATGLNCSDFGTNESIRLSYLWQTTVPIVTSGPTDPRANLTISCTAMSSAYEFATARQLRVSPLLYYLTNEQLSLL